MNRKRKATGEPLVHEGILPPFKLCHRRGAATPFGGSSLEELYDITITTTFLDPKNNFE